MLLQDYSDTEPHMLLLVKLLWRVPISRQLMPPEMT